MNLAGAGAVITGGGSGLGAATARELTAAGARVWILDMDADAGAKIAAEVGGESVAVDVADEDGVAEAIDRAAADAPLRVLVNCAGIGGPPRRTAGSKGAYPLDAFRRVVEVNLVGAFNCGRLAAQAMTELEPLDGGERGVIIHTSSVNAYDGPLGTVAYSAAKAGVVGLTLPMARDLAKFGIRVCTIAPGNFSTPLLLKSPPAFLEQLLQTIPFPRDDFGDPADFARLARHICENRMLNGETIRLDAAVRMSQHD